DFVFTYPGLPIGQAGADLWAVIAWPMPGVNAPVITGSQSGPIVTMPQGNATVFGMTDGYISIVRADGSFTAMPPGLFDVALQDQNALRAKHALPPLPHPSKVTHDKPGRAAKVDAPQLPSL